MLIDKSFYTIIYNSQFQMISYESYNKSNRFLNPKLHQFLLKNIWTNFLRSAVSIGHRRSDIKHRQKSG